MDTRRDSRKQVRRRKRRRTDYAQLDALVRANLLAIARHLHGGLPDNAEGERFLHALLLKKLPATQVLDVAYWASRRGIDSYVEKANDERRIPDADMLGSLIEFYFDDLKAMKRAGYSVRHVAPCDAQRSKVDEFWEDEERKADRERKQLIRKQDNEQSMPTLTKRAKIVLRALRETRWTNVNAIMDAVDLRDQRNRRLAPDALHRAVNRALDELAEVGVIEVKKEIGEHGMVVRFARHVHMVGQDSVFEDNVFEDKKVSDDVANPIKTGTYRTAKRRYFDLSGHLLSDVSTDTPVAERKKASTAEASLLQAPPAPTGSTDAEAIKGLHREETLLASPPSQPAPHPLEAGPGQQGGGHLGQIDEATGLLQRMADEVYDPDDEEIKGAAYERTYREQ